MDEAFAMVTQYKPAQIQQPPAAPPSPLPMPQPPMQPQPQRAPVPPQPSPSYRHQLNQPWQPGPSTNNNFQPSRWPPLPPTCQPSTPAGCHPTSTTPMVPAHTSSALSTPDGQTPTSQASSLREGYRPTTSGVVKAAQHILDDDDDEPSK